MAILDYEDIPWRRGSVDPDNTHDVCPVSRQSHMKPVKEDGRLFTECVLYSLDQPNCQCLYVLSSFGKLVVYV